MLLPKKKIYLIISIIIFLIITSIKKIVDEEYFFDTSKVKTQESLTAKELLFKVNNDQNQLNDMIEKAIEIKGEIKEITNRDHIYTIILKEDSKETLILCEMQKNQNTKVLELKVGKHIKIKGILKGFLMDVILLQCIIIE